MDDAPNPVLGLILLAGAILAATDKLTTWWGIAIVVALGLIAIAAEFGSDYVNRLTAVVDSLLITPAAVAGVFLGFSIFDAWWGAPVGGLVAALVMSIPASLLQAVLE